MRPRGDGPERLLEFLKKYQAEHGYSPTVREMAEGVELRSVQSVYRWLELLRADGRIAWEPNRARTVRINSE